MRNVRFRIKCTSCQKTEDATQQQIDEAREQGVAFSSCCKSVATVEQVSARTKEAKPRICPACYAVSTPSSSTCPSCGADMKRKR